MAKSEPKREGELTGVGLLAVALFLLLCLVPIGRLGEAEGGWLSQGNLMGVVGVGVRWGVFGLFGIGAALLPPLVGLVGCRIGGWIAPERARPLGILGMGLLLLLPLAAALLPVLPAGWGGLLGSLSAPPLIGALGRFGALFLVAVLFILLSLGTLGWNPARAPVRFLAASGLHLLRWSRARMATAWTRWRQVRAQELERASRSQGASLPPWDSGSEEAGGAYGVGGGLRGGGAFGGGFEEEPGEEESTLLLPPDLPGHGEQISLPIPSVVRTDTDALLPDPKDPRELEGDELPPIDLLEPPAERDLGAMERDLDALGAVLVEKLRTFNVESTLAGRTTGPVVTQFEVIPAPGVKVNRIENLEKDLALAMRARTVRIVAPIPGKGAVGVEIPNPVPRSVSLREILESRAFRSARGDLPLALGMDLHGAPYVSDLGRMPHALIAGATGSGKSVCLNTVITSLVYRHTPETLRLLLIDPKMVELSTYADLPHLRHPVVTDPKDAAGVLKWAVLEMERRYALLSENGVRSLAEFNRRVRKGVPLRRVDAAGEEGDPDRWLYREGVLPFVVVVVDELADLMMAVQSEVERPLTLLAQKARAIGLHLIVATQRPSVNVITGLIKANFPCRMAFRVASKVDSRTILDQNGADALLGDGDMLFLPPGQSSPVRIQGAYISTEETDQLLDWYRELRAKKLAEGIEPPGGEADILEIVRANEGDSGGEESGRIGGEWDDLFREAAELCIRSEGGSTSLLQRRLKIGYGRAARIVDQLHDAGVLGPPDGSKPREVMMTLDQLERFFP